MQSDVNVHHGNSGGPVINSDGVVVAVTSFGSLDPSGSGREVPGFNFFVPASLVSEMLRRNSVNNVESTSMKLYGEGLQLYYNRQYKASIERFQTLKNLYPGFPFVDDYIASAQQAILRGEEVQGFPIDISILIVAIAVAGAGGGAGYLLLKRMRRSRGYIEARREPMQSMQPQDINPPLQEKQQGMRIPRGPPSGYKYCINCGKLISDESTRCPYCGAEQ
jgi:hypothetical protein